MPKGAKRNKYGVKEGTNLTAAQQADANAERARINDEIARGVGLARVPEPERSATIKILIQDALLQEQQIEREKQMLLPLLMFLEQQEKALLMFTNRVLLIW